MPQSGFGCMYVDVILGFFVPSDHVICWGYLAKVQIPWIALHINYCEWFLRLKLWWYCRKFCSNTSGLWGICSLSKGICCWGCLGRDSALIQGLFLSSNLQCHSQLLERAGIYSRTYLLVDFCTFLACQNVCTSQMNGLFHCAFIGTQISIHWLERAMQEAWMGL